MFVDFLSFFRKDTHFSNRSGWFSVDFCVKLYKK
nr:MAG TPA: hypothetical protein [Caudoviricetes sp.]